MWLKCKVSVVNSARFRQYAMVRMDQSVQSVQSVLITVGLGVIPLSAFTALGFSQKVMQSGVIKSVIRMVIKVSTMRNWREVSTMMNQGKVSTLRNQRKV
eukprot:493338-Amphidinium_carterae.1